MRYRSDFERWQRFRQSPTGEKGGDTFQRVALNRSPYEPCPSWCARTVPELHPATLTGWNQNSEMLLGWGEIRAFPLISLEVRIVYPKIASMYENVISLHMRSNRQLESGFYVGIQGP